MFSNGFYYSWISFGCKGDWMISSKEHILVIIFFFQVVFWGYSIWLWSQVFSSWKETHLLIEKLVHSSHGNMSAFSCSFLTRKLMEETICCGLDTLKVFVESSPCWCPLHLDPEDPLFADQKTSNVTVCWMAP